MLVRQVVVTCSCPAWQRVSKNSINNDALKRCLSFSRMLDLGGMPSSATDKKATRRVNASKNSKVQAVAFDFDLLTRCLQSDRQTKATVKKELAELQHNDHDKKSLGKVTPDVNAIQQVASLLGVSLGSERTPLAPATDDLSSITGRDSSVHGRSPKADISKTITTASSSTPFHDPGDVRSKYASKLRNRLDGGVAGLEVAQAQREDSLKQGDASFHLAAREHATTTSVNSTSTRWMALTGTGALLNYLSNRSIKIALLPKPDHPHPEHEGKQMKDFTSQLPEVHVDVVLEIATAGAGVSIQQALKLLQPVDPITTLLVSDRDDYIRAAKDAGMITCRIRPLNAPRGNASAHYSKEQVADVQEVIDEMNGISFNALVNR